MRSRMCNCGATYLRGCCKQARLTVASAMSIQKKSARDVILRTAAAPQRGVGGEALHEAPGVALNGVTCCTSPSGDRTYRHRT